MTGPAPKTITPEELEKLERLLERHHTTWDALDLIWMVSTLPRLLTSLKKARKEGREEAAKAVECLLITGGNDCREVAGMRAFRAVAARHIRSLSPKDKNEASNG